jgi:phosphohistidine phosphatase
VAARRDGAIGAPLRSIVRESVVMDVLLWRHAEAQDLADGLNDWDRPLTRQGEKQAAHMAIWLNRHMPEGVRIYSSPAARATQTAHALARPYKVRDELHPLGDSADVLQLLQWPQRKGAVLIVGHQPVLGDVLSRMLDLPQGELHVRKGAVWWVRCKATAIGHAGQVVCVQSPDHID